jgi:2-dehydro-3-deoxygluconokinase
MKNDTLWDVLALGEAMVEFNQTHPGQPQYLQGFGGDTSNTVIAAARAGARSGYLTRLGDDSFGRSLMALWRAEGVDTSAVETVADASTGIYFVTHGPNGHEFSYRRAGSAAARMTPDWLDRNTAEDRSEKHAAANPKRHIAAAKLLHVSGISLAISPSALETSLAAMRWARSQGTQVSFDSNLRLKLWGLDAARAAITQAVALSDYFLPSLEDMVALIGLHGTDTRAQAEAIINWGHAHGAGTVVLKLGAEGALVSDGTRCEQVPGVPVTLVDATGAGDCFCGNLLARLAAGDDVFTAARYANAAAALAVQGFGAVAPLPRAAQVQDSLC